MINCVGIDGIIKGDGVVIVSPCNLYGCNLGNDVFVGPFVEIKKECGGGSQSHSITVSYVTCSHR